MSRGWDACGSSDDWMTQSARGMPVVGDNFQSDLRRLMVPPHPAAPPQTSPAELTRVGKVGSEGGEPGDHAPSFRPLRWWPLWA